MKSSQRAEKEQKCAKQFFLAISESIKNNQAFILDVLHAYLRF